MRAGFGENCVGWVLVCPDMPLVHMNGMGVTLCALEAREDAHEPNRPREGGVD